eukprot:GHVT01031598.1.p1 GENE.GHVT01031598.1~~GHVT01031598.1.p1  ORF type:complete len:117 (+),score=42.80 GHVT01031598.1:141-491(+)
MRRRRPALGPRVEGEEEGGEGAWASAAESGEAKGCAREPEEEEEGELEEEGPEEEKEKEGPEEELEEGQDEDGQEEEEQGEEHTQEDSPVNNGSTSSFNCAAKRLGKGNGAPTTSE